MEVILISMLTTQSPKFLSLLELSALAKRLRRSRNSATSPTRARAYCRGLARFRVEGSGQLHIPC